MTDMNEKEINKKNILAYAAYTIDTELKMESSSGGKSGLKSKGFSLWCCI